MPRPLAFLLIALADGVGIWLAARFALGLDGDAGGDWRLLALAVGCFALAGAGLVLLLRRR